MTRQASSVEPSIETFLANVENRADELIQAAQDHAYKIVKAQWKRYSADPRLYFDTRSAKAAVRFFPKFLKHSKAPWAGKPFKLERWQRVIVLIIFGFKWKKSKLRVVRRLFLFIARKNGKSTFCAGLAILLLVADGERGAEIYGAAADKKQAKIVFAEAVNMIRASPKLMAATETFKEAITCPKLSGAYQVISSVASTKHGLNPSGVVIDELHTQKTRELYDTLHTAVGARAQPLEIYMTTAGDDKRTICGEVYDEAKRVLSGQFEDIAFLPVIFEADKDDDWRDPLTLAKPNPSLGVSARIEYLIEEIRKASRRPSVLNTFLRLHLNRWTTQLERWIPPEAWAACKGIVPWQNLPEMMLGKSCIGAFDLSANRDITCWGKLFDTEHDDEPLIWIPKFYIPGDNIPDRVERDKVEYDIWARQGALTTTEGNVVDYRYIEQDIIDDAGRYTVREIAYDAWAATSTATNLQGEGLTVVQYRQGFAGMSEPSKRLEVLINTKEIAHGGHPVMDWMIGNVALARDNKENIMPSKGRSREKIDGAVTLIMAIGRSISPDSAAPQTPICIMIEGRL